MAHSAMIFAEDKKTAIKAALAVPKEQKDIQKLFGLKNNGAFFAWLLTCEKNGILIYEEKRRGQKIVYGLLQK